ncbi:type II toxin-antitoxin system HicA family toxin [Methanoplanus endosymbiosus]|uniref:Type II toxin-antitoxin system HicA family toxin n=1 Tax=Methanoplanus endosymbiosus TaxID=33865 RepID=A0A9E7PRQ4_9EURY|nr:type II toxin-antitoxin system HicA family toxin [Methanoplanus endosymbiosus]UUX93876.1 type II toxin-antitoxin system HicA family toxin [Methanoplanus endosymbiosus]
MSGHDAVKAFSKAGWVVRRQTGNHVIMKREGMPLILSVPLHSEMKRGTLRDLISDSGMTTDEFVNYL